MGKEKENWLVVWNMAFIFPYIGNNNPIPFDFHIFQRGVSTTNQGRNLDPWDFLLKSCANE